MDRQVNTPLSAVMLRGAAQWLPRRLRGHLVKHLAPFVMGKGFLARTPDRGIYPFLNTPWDASRYHGIFELDESAFLKSVGQPGMTVVDVGANVGWYTALFAQQVGPTRKVVAVAPDPSNLARIKAYLEANQCEARVTVVETAVADKEGTITLFLNSDSGANTINKELGTGYGALSPGTVEVRVQTLDALLSSTLPANSTIDLLKIDIERAELLALQGLTATLRSGYIRSIYIEVTDVKEADAETRLTSWINYCAKLATSATHCSSIVRAS